jgi:hypothetical protein
LFPTDGLGSTLAQSPPSQGNIRIRYDVLFDQYAGYRQVAAQHVNGFDFVLLVTVNRPRTLGLQLACKF